PRPSGVAFVTEATDSVALKPPPDVWLGGCSSVVPRRVTLDVPVPHGGRSTDTDMSAEVRARRSATPARAGDVVMSTMRKRSRVMGVGVLFVHLRRNSRVPSVELSGASGVTSRSLFGGANGAAHESTRPIGRFGVTLFAVSTGDSEFSG